MDFKERLEIERYELQDKLKNLQNFIARNEKFHELSEIQQSLLVVQSKAMDTYYQCLVRRINNL